MRSPVLPIPSLPWSLSRVMSLPMRQHTVTMRFGFAGALGIGVILTGWTYPVPARAQQHAAAPVEVAEPADYRMNDYRAPVPRSLKGAEVVDGTKAAALQAEGAVMIDVYPRAPKPAGLPQNAIWRSPKHTSIKGAFWLPNVGYGKLAPEPEAYFRSSLDRLSGGAKDRPLVFFCLKDCWMSWNAAKRALEWGYSRVVWFPDGTDGWQAIGNELVNVEPEAGGG